MGRHGGTDVSKARSPLSRKAETRRFKMTIALPARAKLNLDLAVLRRRDDGFHDVRTTLQAIDLHDLVSLTPADKTSLTISGLAVKNAKDNSALKALAALEEAAQKKLPTEIHLHKRIPAGA